MTGEDRATGNGGQEAGEGGATRSRRQHTREGVAGKGKRWMVGGCHPTCRPTVSPTTVPCSRAGEPPPPPAMYSAALLTAPMQQHPQAGGATSAAQGVKGEALRRAWERIGEEERRLQEREAPAIGGRARAPGTPGGGEAHAVEELQRAWADIRRWLERVERTEQDGQRPGEQVQRSTGEEDRSPLQPFRQVAINPEVERQVQERAWKRIRGEAARLEERVREVAERECRVREELEAAAPGAHRVIPDPERGTPPTDTEGRLPSGKRAGGEGGEGRHARGKRRRLEEKGTGGATVAPQPASPSLEPTPTDWRSESLLPRRYAQHSARRVPGTVQGWRAGEMAELVRHLN